MFTLLLIKDSSVAFSLMFKYLVTNKRFDCFHPTSSKDTELLFFLHESWQSLNFLNVFSFMNCRYVTLNSPTNKSVQNSKDTWVVPQPTPSRALQNRTSICLCFLKPEHTINLLFWVPLLNPLPNSQFFIILGLKCCNAVYYEMCKKDMA